MSVVRLCVSRTWSKAACTTFSDLESSADVASSRIKARGSRISARAMATRCFWPPESWMPLSPTCVSKPSGNDFTKSKAFAILAAFSIFTSSSAESVWSAPALERP